MRVPTVCFGVAVVLGRANPVRSDSHEQQPWTVGGPRSDAWARVTTCLSGLAPIDPATVHVTDSRTGILVELKRAPR